MPISVCTTACITLPPVPTNITIAATTIPPAIMSRRASSLRFRGFIVEFML